MNIMAGAPLVIHRTSGPGAGHACGIITSGGQGITNRD